MHFEPETMSVASLTIEQIPHEDVTILMTTVKRTVLISPRD
jgi:hypothetical protein